jgi:hypothetical protein
VTCLTRTMTMNPVQALVARATYTEVATSKLEAVSQLVSDLCMQRCAPSENNRTRDRCVRASSRFSLLLVRGVPESYACHGLFEHCVHAKPIMWPGVGLFTTTSLVVL